ncbi:MAG: FAD-binding oxidoreductase [Desulfobacterales bacterium]|nr:FAD-binding oxidoreductase [Desulfobacterales bacterium]
MGDKIYDVIIVGGGIMGSSTAYYLTRADHTLKVAVVERDPTYTRASTTLSMVNARIQFSLKQNVEISQYAFDVLENFEEEMVVDHMQPKIAYHREGNLFLLDEPGKKAALEALALQQGLGCRSQWWSVDEIRDRYPLYAPEAYTGGTFGPDDGHFDAYAVLMGYKAKARSQGAVYMEDEVVDLLRDGKQIAGVALASGERLSAGCVVNCAGAWAAEVARKAGVKIPVDPVRRQCFAVDTAIKPQGPLPLTILPSGFYFRTEAGGLVLVGKSMADDTVGYDFTWNQNRFLDHLWFELAEFVPAFESLKLVRGWAGLYAVNTLDGNAILGQWPELKGFYLANGFSGHGLQQGPAVGRYLSELITGSKLTLDLSIFGPERILEGSPLSEGGLV